jgi:hypothetical protein
MLQQIQPEKCDKKQQQLKKMDHYRFSQKIETIRDIPVKKVQEMVFIYNAIHDGWKVYKDRSKNEYVLYGNKHKEVLTHKHFAKKMETYIQPSSSI